MTRAKPNRYTAAPSAEAEYQAGSRGRVLRNLLGVTSKRAMDRLEFEALVAAQLRYSEELITADTRFTAALIRQMHRDWLGAIYAWAGEYRTVNVAKGGFAWPPAYLLASHMAALEAGLLRECTPCRGAGPAEVAASITRVHGDLLLIHPFREGNGRVARWLGDLMAQQAGLPAPEWRLSGREGRSAGERYLECVKSAYVEDYRPLTAFVAEAIEAALAERRRASAGRSPRAPSKTEES